MDQMDEVAVRLDQLLREGKISKDQIFYKYLSDTVAKFYDNNIHMMRMLLSFIPPSCT